MRSLAAVVTPVARYEETLGINSGKAMSLRSMLIGLPIELKRSENTLRRMSEDVERAETSMGPIIERPSSE